MGKGRKETSEESENRICQKNKCHPWRNEKRAEVSVPGTCLPQERRKKGLWSVCKSKKEILIDHPGYRKSIRGYFYTGYFYGIRGVFYIRNFSESPAAQNPP